MKPKFDSIESVVADIRRGRMVIVVDDEDRENEGDLILAAQHTTPAAVNFLARFGRGLICVAAPKEHLARLGIDRMVHRNRESFRTDFQVSVDAAHGIASGISAADRARTIQLLADPKTQPDDLVQPGHVFPLRSQPGGVLRRAGHTEAAADLAALAGLPPVGVLCEIMNDNGTMARLPQLAVFARKHRIKLCTIAELIEYRRTRERMVERVEAVRMPTDWGDFDLHLYRSVLDGQNHVALVCGEVAGQRDVLVRVHRECAAGDLFGSRRCGCGERLHGAMRQVAAAGRGVIIYLRTAGLTHGIPGHCGLSAAAGEADREMDLREYGLGAQILADLGLQCIKLITNHPRRLVGLEGHGLKVTGQVPFAGSEPKTKTGRK